MRIFFWKIAVKLLQCLSIVLWRLDPSVLLLSLTEIVLLSAFLALNVVYYFEK